MSLPSSKRPLEVEPSCRAEDLARLSAGEGVCLCLGSPIYCPPSPSCSSRFSFVTAVHRRCSDSSYLLYGSNLGTGQNSLIRGKSAVISAFLLLFLCHKKAVLQVAYWAQLFQLSEAVAGKALSGSRLISIGTLAALTLCLVLSTPPTQALSRYTFSLFYAILCSAVQEKSSCFDDSFKCFTGVCKPCLRKLQTLHEQSLIQTARICQTGLVSGKRHIFRLGLAASLAITATLLAAAGLVAAWQLSQKGGNRAISRQSRSELTAATATQPSRRAETEPIPIGIAWQEIEEDVVSPGTDEAVSFKACLPFASEAK